MKKLIQLLILFILTTGIHAQTFEGGFFAGITASQVDGDTYSGYNKLGFSGGGYISNELGRNTGWKAELRFTQKGAYKKNTEQDNTLYRLSIYYVEIPLLFQYMVNDKVILDGGLAPDVYLTHQEENEFGELNQENRPSYHRFGLNAVAGVNYAITRRLIAGVRFSYSAIPMRDHASGATYYLNRGQYNNNLYFTFYYHFE